MSDTYTPCPECGSDNVARERSPDGDTFCYDCDLRLPHEDWDRRQFIAELNAQDPQQISRRIAERRGVNDTFSGTTWNWRKAYDKDVDLPPTYASRYFENMEAPPPYAESWAFAGPLLDELQQIEMKRGGWSHDYWGWGIQQVKRSQFQCAPYFGPKQSSPMGVGQTAPAAIGRAWLLADELGLLEGNS